MAKSESHVQRYRQQFERAHAAGGAPAWLQELRGEAMHRFAEVGFPTSHDEEWRFTSVQPIADGAFEAASAGELDSATTERLAGKPREGSQLVFVDGRFVPAASKIARLPKGVRVESLSGALTSDDELVRDHFGRHARADLTPFAALSTAFALDGAFVYVPANTELTDLVELVFVSGGKTNTISYPRSLIVVGSGARATVQETYLTSGNGTSLTNAVTEVVVGPNGRLDHCRLQSEAESSYHVAITRSHQERDSVFESCSVAFGSGLSRHDLGAVLGGSNAFLTLNGLSVLGGRQHVDYHTVIDHAQPHCESHEVFNGVFNDHARGIFNGRIVVRPGAQRTDSKQTNNNLLLSSEARADSQPQLEIYADDVKCTHGATLGPLDDATMFYLQSRGIGAAAARRMLTYGFGADIVGRIKHPAIRQGLDRALADRLRRLLSTSAA